jgi:RNA polymerase sigma-70 factor (ECF subfamily)
VNVLPHSAVPPPCIACGHDANASAILVSSRPSPCTAARSRVSHMKALKRGGSRACYRLPDHPYLRGLRCCTICPRDDMLHCPTVPVRLGGVLSTHPDFQVSTHREPDALFATDGKRGRSVNADPVERTHYENLYHMHYQRVMRLCRLLLADAHEAEDVAQEVFLKLYRAFQAQPPQMAWGPWLTRVAINACRDRRRSGWWKRWRGPYSASRQGVTPEDAGQREVWLGLEAHRYGPTPEEEILSAERRGQIWRAFRKLSLRQQEVFVLRYLEGWSTEAVADTLGLSVGSVKQHLFRAIRRLRTVIGGEA